MKTDRLAVLPLFVLLFLFLGSVSFAEPLKGAATTEIRYAVGYRTDSFDWNIADSDGVPDVLSELTWNNQSALEFKASSIYRGKIYVRGSVDYAFILSGTNRDSDFTGNNRAGEYSRSDNVADTGALWDASIGIGKEIKGRNLDFAFLGGFSVHGQNFNMTEGFQTVCLSPCSGPTGSFAGLDSSYDSVWYGPWVGIDVNYLSKDRKFSAFTNLEYHLARYYADANWNLRSDLRHPKSFEHEADGSGVVLNIGVDYKVSRRVSMGWEFDYQGWSTSGGTDRTFFSNGSVGITRLNEVNWRSVSLLGLVRYRF